MSEAGVKKKFGWKLIIPVLAVFLVLALGPTLALNLILSRVIPDETGLTVEYRKARAGFLFRSARVRDLVLTGGPAVPEGRLKADLVELKGLSVRNLIRLLQRPEDLPAEPLFLASRVNLKGLEYQFQAERFSLRTAQMGQLRLAAGASGQTIPVRFDKLEVRELALSTGADPDFLTVSGLDARNLGAEVLGGLTIRDLALSVREGAGAETPLQFQVWGLTLGGLRLDSLLRMRSESGLDLAAWWLLAGCDTLDLAQAVLARRGQEALNIRSARFDLNTPTQEGPTTYTRRLNFSADLTALVDRPDDPFWRDLRDFTGDKFQAELHLALNYDRQSGEAQLTQGLLDAPGLGRLDLTARLGGVTRVEPHLSLSQLLFSAAEAGWRWEGLSLAFQDRGLMGNFYRHLTRTVFRGLPSRSPVDNILAYYVDPLALTLAREQGLANLPALLSETEAFLERPDRLALWSIPGRPLPLRSLANPDKYDIIEKLRLTVQVNDRAPIAVAVASGVFQENLPLAPKPMENFFTEEDI